MNSDQAKPFAVVTGGSSGIGYELAKQFVQNGYDVLIAANDDGHLAQAARSLAASDGGSQVETVKVDLATSEGREALYSALTRIGRPVDALCVNAGIDLGGPFLETDLDREVEMMNLNVVGAVHLTKLVLRDMAARNQGGILFTSSIAGTMPTPFEAVYGATKAFLRSFGESLHNELKDTGIHVTVLMPGVTDTNFFHRADMDDTKVGVGSKDDPAMVAKTGFAAFMAGKDKVVAGLKNKAMVGMNAVRSEQATAESHRKMAEPGSAIS